jgi:hypothetical protein
VNKITGYWLGVLVSNLDSGKLVIFFGGTRLASWVIRTYVWKVTDCAVLRSTKSKKHALPIRIGRL